MITQSILKELLHYDHYTGWFTWTKRRSNQLKEGSAAGYKHHSGYVFICIERKKYAAHRLAWLYMIGNFPDGDLDHINGIKHDNRWVNLRKATDNQNRYNSVVGRNNKLGVKGVCRVDNRYRVYATINGKINHLGYFYSLEEAKTARQNFCKKYHGDYYRE